MFRIWMLIVFIGMIGIIGSSIFARNQESIDLIILPTPIMTSTAVPTPTISTARIDPAPISNPETMANRAVFKFYNLQWIFDAPCQYHSSIYGKASWPGTRDRPWDLVTASRKRFSRITKICMIDPDLTQTPIPSNIPPTTVMPK